MTKGIPELDSWAGKCLSGEQELKTGIKSIIGRGSVTERRCGRPPEDTPAVLIMATQPAPFQHVTDKTGVENYI